MGSLFTYMVKAAAGQQPAPYLPMERDPNYHRAPWERRYFSWFYDKDSTNAIVQKRQQAMDALHNYITTHGLKGLNGHYDSALALDYMNEAIADMGYEGVNDLDTFVSQFQNTTGAPGVASYLPNVINELIAADTIGRGDYDIRREQGGLDSEQWADAVNTVAGRHAIPDVDKKLLVQLGSMKGDARRNALRMLYNAHQQQLRQVPQSGEQPAATSQPAAAAPQPAAPAPQPTAQPAAAPKPTTAPVQAPVPPNSSAVADSDKKFGERAWPMARNFVRQVRYVFRPDLKVHDTIQQNIDAGRSMYDGMTMSTPGMTAGQKHALTTHGFDGNELQRSDAVRALQEAAHKRGQLHVPSEHEAYTGAGLRMVGHSADGKTRTYVGRSGRGRITVGANAQAGHYRGVGSVDTNPRSNYANLRQPATTRPVTPPAVPPARKSTTTSRR